MTEGPSINSSVPTGGQPAGSSGEIKRIKDEVSSLCESILSKTQARADVVSNAKVIKSLEQLKTRIDSIDFNKEGGKGKIADAVHSVKVAIESIALKQPGLIPEKKQKKAARYELDFTLRKAVESLDKAAGSLRQMEAVHKAKKADTTPAGSFALFSKLSKTDRETVFAEVAMDSNNPASAPGKKGLNHLVEQCKLSYLSDLKKLSGEEKNFVNEIVNARTPAGQELVGAVNFLKNSVDSKKASFPGEVRKLVQQVIEDAMPNNKNLNIMVDYIAMRLMSPTESDA